MAVIRVNPAQAGRGTNADWAAEDPVLARGEFGWAQDLDIVKIGDGESPWSELPAVGQSLLPTRSATEFSSLQDGINYLGDLGGGTLVLPAPSYNISAPLDLATPPGVHLQGAGRGGTVIRQSELDAPIMQLGGAYKGLRDLQLRYASPATAGGNAIQIEGFLSYCNVTNLHVWNCHNGIAYGNDISPRGEFSNYWANLRLNTFAGSAIKLADGVAPSTGSLWNNIYVNNYTGSGAGACSDYPVHLQNHKAVFNQLNIEWCSPTNHDLALFQQCKGVTINGLHQEGNALVAGRAFLATFSADTTVSVDGWQIYNNVAASGSVGLVRPGAGTTVLLRGVTLDENADIDASLYVVLDASLATGTYIDVRGLDDPDSHLDGFALNYVGNASVNGYPGGAWSINGAPTATETVTDLATLITALAAKGIVIDGT